MPKTITLRIGDSLYNKIKNHATKDNRPISNFIETATIRYIEEIDFVDEFEMEEIKQNANLIKSLNSGSRDAKLRNGKLIG